MNSAPDHDERIAKMTFASVYPHYLANAEKKGRTKVELRQVIKWLTGYDEKMLRLRPPSEFVWVFRKPDVF